MHAFPLLLTALILFGLILGFEASADPTQPKLRAFGLLAWLTSGNWPAKVGAGLLLIGIGSLLRFTLLNVELPAQLKLGGGIVLSAALGGCALMLKGRPGRRAIELALAGLAFGVAYLTAYSAYGYFGYINAFNALALLAMVALAAGAFAVWNRALSVAVLAMAGAYIAPRFAIGNPGPLAVYGYYLAASILTLLMVMLRGWRPLIHLSFLFTLAGALFFGWSGKFYQAEYYALMQPLLLALVAVHLAMPLLERSALHAGWPQRFDSVYFILLPCVAAGLTLKIAPVVAVQGVFGLGALALLWGIASGLLVATKREGATRYGALAALLLLGAYLCWGPTIAWPLLGMVVALILLAVAPAMRWSFGFQVFASGMVLTGAALHMLTSVMDAEPSTLFANAVFSERIAASALLLLAGWIGRRRQIELGNVLAVTGVAWAVLAVSAELLRLNLDFGPQLAYGLLLAAIGVLAAAGRRLPLSQAWGAALLLGMIACGWWAAPRAGADCALAYLVFTPLALLALTWRYRVTQLSPDSDFTASVALAMLPLALLPWLGVRPFPGGAHTYFEATVVVAAALVAAIVGRICLPYSARWNGSLKAMHFVLVATALMYMTVLHIERGVWPVAFDIVALGYLVSLSVAQLSSLAPFRFATTGVVLTALVLVLQAMVLRVLGPDGVLTVADIGRITVPAVLALLWAMFGAALAFAGVRIKSRSLWSAGALLLAGAAGKLVFFDLGSLDQLGNILALIGAGLVFMAVAWFAPMPAAAAPPAVKPPPAPRAAKASSTTPSSTTPSSTTPSSVMAAGAPPAPRPAATIRVAQGGSAQLHAAQDNATGLWIGVLVLAFVIAFACLVVQRQGHRVAELRTLAANRLADAAKVEAATPSAPPVSLLAVPEPAPESALPPAPAQQPTAIDTVAAVAARSAVAPPRDACGMFKQGLPADYVVYTGGAYGGRKLSSTHPISGHHLTAFDVTVNAPGQRVALVLGAYEPSTWTIQASASTTIVGIVVSGYHSQVIAAAPDGVPSMVSSYEQGAPCGYFYVGSEGSRDGEGFVRALFGRQASARIVSKDGRLLFGQSSRPTAAVGTSEMEKYVDENGHIGFRQARPAQ